MLDGPKPVLTCYVILFDNYVQVKVRMSLSTDPYTDITLKSLDPEHKLTQCCCCWSYVFSSYTNCYYVI